MNPKAHTHRKQSLEVPQPVPPPTAQELGTLTHSLQTIIAGGPDALQLAQRQATRAAGKHGEAYEAEWFLLTDYLRELRQSTDGRSRRRAHYAIMWRPKWLAALSVTGSRMAAARHARVDHLMVTTHVKLDSQFEAQANAAHSHFVELMHDRVKQRALEGDCEPVFYMGVPCGWVRKFDSRLQIEVLRAHLPQTYKSPGDKPITINNTTNVLVLDAATRHQIQAARAEALREMAARLPLPAAAGAEG